MEKYKLGAAMRLFFLFAGSVMWLGIWLTGISTVHWILFMPASFFLVAAATGICPGIIFMGRLTSKK